MSAEVIRGVFDMHVHSSPDNAPRKTDDIDLAKTAAEVGMGGFMIKAHQGSTVERAYLTQRAVGGIKVFGGLVLNYTVGGLNPNAVGYYVRLGAKEIWMPSLSSDYMVTYMKKNVAMDDRKKFHLAHGSSDDENRIGPKHGESWPWVRNDRGISIFNEDGKVCKEAWEILEIMAPTNAILGTSHLSIPETFALVEAARDVGVERILVTHPEYMAQMNTDDQILLSRQGVFFERCFVMTTVVTKNIGGYKPMDLIVENIRKVGIETTVLGTDFGQAINPHPVDGMMEYLSKLSAAGFSDKEIERMGVKNPSNLLDV
jgi:hypothetical protein